MGEREEFIADFVEECDENLDQVRGELDALRQGAPDADRFARIYRSIHTIRGSSGFLGLTRINALAFEAERLAGAVRDGAAPTGNGVLDLLGRACDAIADLCDAVVRTGQEGQRSHQPIADSIRQLLDDDGGESDAADEPADAASTEAAEPIGQPSRPDTDDKESIAARTGNVRVLLVDDSPIVRSVLSETLAMYPDIKVAGEARDGVEGLERLASDRPDVVLLDVDMPRMDGLEMLRQMRQRRSSVPVLMFSSRTEQGAKVTTDALLLGAEDFVFKPGGTNMRDPDAGKRAIVDEIVPRLRSLAGKRDAGVESGDTKSIGPSEVGRVELVVVGASTGGPAAIAQLMDDKQLQENLFAPIVIAQHMPKLFTKHLAQRLALDTGLNITEVGDGEVLESGMIRITPGGRHAIVERRRQSLATRLHDQPPVNSCRPSADVLFQSAAATAGPGVLAVVLTGMGNDGRNGCRTIRNSGGRIIVQDEASSVVWGMPGAVAKEGLADHVVPLQQIGVFLASHLRDGRAPTS